MAVVQFERVQTRGLDFRLRRLYAAAGASGGLLVPFWALIFNARGFSASQIGLLLGVYAAVGSLLIMLWSSVADRHWGSARTLRLALIGTSISSVILELAGRNFAASLAAMVLLSTTACSQGGLLDTLALRYLGHAGGGRYSSFRVGASFGWAITVVLFGIVLQKVGMGLALPAFAVGSLVYLAATRGFTDSFVSSTPERASRLGSCADALTGNQGFQRFLIGACLIGMGTAVAMAFFPLRVGSADAGVFTVGMAVGLSAAVEIPCMLLAGPLSNRYGLRTCFAISVAIYVAQAIVWAINANPIVAACVRISVGFSFGLCWVTSVRIANSLVPSHLQNAGQLLIQIVYNGVGTTLGLVWGGLAYQHLGAMATYCLCAVCVAVGGGVAARGLAPATLAKMLPAQNGSNIEHLLEPVQA